MSVRQVDDLNLFLIGVWRSSFFDGAGSSWDWEGCETLWQSVEGNGSSWGKGGRVSSWSVIPIGVCGGVVLSGVLGGMESWVKGGSLSKVSGDVSFLLCWVFFWESCVALVGGGVITSSEEFDLHVEVT